jgi:hypothetical protein
MKVPIKGFTAGFVMFLVAACGDTARVPEESTFGPNPILPEPNETLIPTVNIAPARVGLQTESRARLPAFQSVPTPPGSIIRAGSMFFPMATS